MKKILYCLFLIFLFPTFVKAASGPVYVYYEESGRYPTYTSTNKYMGSIGYTVYARENWDSSGLKNALSDAKIAVFHDHGSPGKQSTGFKNGVEYGIAAKNADGNNYKNVIEMTNGSMNQAKMIIMYGCSTGDNTSINGDLPMIMVNKGAQAAVAWFVSTKVGEVNIWNEEFFKKVKNNNIVEGYRSADYWIGIKRGSEAKKRMKNHRNEAGNIYGYVY